MEPQFERFDKSKHERKHFTCGVEALDDYLKKQASQDIKRGVTQLYVRANEEGDIGAYYTLSAYTVALDELPPDFAKKLPRHPNVPAILLGRLAVHKQLQGQGLGSVTIADALMRAFVVSSEWIGVGAVVVDAIGESAAEFYQRHGFMLLPNSPLKLFVPITTVKQMFS